MIDFEKLKPYAMYDFIIDGHELINLICIKPYDGPTYAVCFFMPISYEYAEKTFHKLGANGSTWDIYENDIVTICRSVAHSKCNKMFCTIRLWPRNTNKKTAEYISKSKRTKAYKALRAAMDSFDCKIHQGMCDLHCFEQMDRTQEITSLPYAPSSEKTDKIIERYYNDK